ncbi:MAG: diacylglycerol kinase family protein [Patescibacteria group bacterium]
MKNLLNSFKFAFNGIKDILIFERNFRIMILISLIVVGGMFYFPLIRLEKAVLLVMIFSVLILELMNVIIEKIMDFLQPQHDERVKIIKDLSAAIVLIASFGAAIIGLIIFLPYIF